MRALTSKLMMTLAMASMGLAGCATDESMDGALLEPEELDESAGEDGKFEAWNQANNPAYVDTSFLYFVSQLPVSGAAPDPIPSDYWATAHDSLNHKWDGANSLSPAEKYAKVFGKAGVPEQISRNNGVKSATARQTCTTEADCDSLNDGSICAASFDGAVKRCIPTWWGICHGWAPYALVEPAARQPVTRTAPDGTAVTFYPGDIESYMSLLYTDVSSKFISSRCNRNEPPTDAAGRVIAGECRDMNPGSWHVIVTNLIGLQRKGFVLDQTWDDEVWNQPVRDFAITNLVDGQLPEVSKDQAMALLGANLSIEPLLAGQRLAKDEEKRGTYTVTAAGPVTIKMTGTGDADLYVKNGAAPTTAAGGYDCRPYEGNSEEECVITAAAGDVIHYLVLGYAADSNVGLSAVRAGQGGAYTFNPAAKRFFHVKMRFRFVVEGRPSRSALIEDIDQYTSTKSYEYLLETDDNGKILGGEWLGASRTDHPDFAWWPTSKPLRAQAGGLITYNEVLGLNTEAAGAPPVTDELRVAEGHDMGVTANQWKSKYWTFQIEPGVKKIEVTMSGTGAAELYVRKGQNPTLTVFNCKSTTAGTAAQTCSTTVPASGGMYYVRARSKTVGTTLNVAVRKQR